MEQELSNAAVAVVGVAAVGSLGTWTIIAQRLRQYGYVIPSVPRLSVPWNGWHIMLAFFAYVMLPLMALTLSGVRLDAEGATQAEVEQKLAALPPEDLARLMAYSSLFSLLALFIVAGLVMLLTQARQEDFGLSADHGRVGRDVVLGVFGFMAATLPVLGVQFMVSLLVEYDHPVLEMLGQSATNQLWIVALLSAVVVAPLAEEFLFRVLLQGWLERLALGPLSGITRVVATQAKDNIATGDMASELDQFDPATSSPGGQPPETLFVRQPVEARAVWPIWVSATVFALMHLGQGAAPIPLLLLGAILGYLYRQTHRIVPCVVLHALFNLFSLLIFRLSVQS